MGLRSRRRWLPAVMLYRQARRAWTFYGRWGRLFTEINFGRDDMIVRFPHARVR